MQKNKGIRKVFKSDNLGIFVALVGVIVLFSMINKNYFTTGNTNGGIFDGTYRSRRVFAADRRVYGPVRRLSGRLCRCERCNHDAGRDAGKCDDSCGTDTGSSDWMCERVFYYAA